MATVSVYAADARDLFAIAKFLLITVITSSRCKRCYCNFSAAFSIWSKQYIAATVKNHVEVSKMVLMKIFK